MMKEFVFIVSLILFTSTMIGGEITPVEYDLDNLDLSAKAGSYDEASEEIGAEGSKKLVLNLSELRNGTNWAPGIQVTFMKDGYENCVIFNLIQKEDGDEFLTPFIRYKRDDEDVFRRDLGQKFEIGNPVTFWVKWDASGTYYFSFSPYLVLRFKADFIANKIIYSVGSGRGTIKKAIEPIQVADKPII